MDKKIIEIVSEHIQRQFPEMAGVLPKVRHQGAGDAASARQKATTSQPGTYLLTYQRQITIASGKTLPRWVRVVVTADGKILKVTTSR